MDLLKAFDCIDIDILLEKLEEYEIMNKQLKLMMSYLRDRPQSVVIKEKNINNQSKTREKRTRVQQGIILGPLFFGLYK